MSDSKTAHYHLPAISQREYCHMLEKRALAMSQKNGSLPALDSAFCAFLIAYLEDHDEKTSALRFTAKLTGIFVRALEELAHPTTLYATRFIERYNKIGRQNYRQDWKDIKAINLTHLDGPDYQLDFLHVVKSVSRFIIGGHEYNPVDLSVLESEQKVLLLHFQRFLAEIWEKAGASEKEQKYENALLTGVFGHAKFTTYHLDTYLVFKFSDSKDDYYSFRLAAPAEDHAGYLAKIAECKVDLISALQMIREVAVNFDLADYREPNPNDLPPILPN